MPELPEVILTMARLCNKAYGDECEMQDVVVVDQFHVGGEMLAFVETPQSLSEDAFVVFRGTTRTLGHWLIINLQAYLKPDEGVRGYGSIHQGFYRATSLLWRHADPVPRPTVKAFIEAALNFRALRTALALAAATAIVAKVTMIFAAVFAVQLLTNKGLLCAGALGFVLSLCLVAALASGWAENVFRKPAVISGRPLQCYAPELAAYKRVWFMGHSLGGALATLCFAEARADPRLREKAYLVTFGAPRIGDVEFVRRFEQDHSDRYLHLVNRSDPVPEMPPSSLSKARHLLGRGPLGFTLGVLYVPWALFSHVWGTRYADWERCRDAFGVESRLSSAQHAMKTYCRYIRTRS
jgi:hypothetical protein